MSGEAGAQAGSGLGFQEYPTSEAGIASAEALAEVQASQAMSNAEGAAMANARNLAATARATASR
eukprot:14411842-Alexandrium_andersonii.AAC.1